jgi:hypothetical protein
MTDFLRPITLAALVCLTACTGPDDASPSSFLERHDTGKFQLRFLSWNVKNGWIFPPEGRRHAGFARIVRAVNPNILVLQEVNSRVTDRLAQVMNLIISLGNFQATPGFTTGRAWRVSI